LKTILTIGAITGLLRLDTSGGAAPRAAALLVGALALAATAYGISVNGRSQPRVWRIAWALMGAGLVGIVVGVVLEANPPGRSPIGVAPLVATLLGDGLAVAGLALLIRDRLPGRASEALGTAIVAAVSIAFIVLALVVVPAKGWSPATQLPALGLPLADVVMLWLVLSLIVLTGSHPVGYRYLLAGFSCIFLSDAVASGLALAHVSGEAFPPDVLVLWGACLWGCSAIHPSQRTPFDPVPLRPTRPSWAHVALMLVAAIVVPVVLATASAMGFHDDVPGLLISSTALPVLIVLYLLHQVFTRSAAEYRAQHDALTGICNRTLFDDRLSASLVDARQSDRGLAVMFLDLDRFKSINDTLGHSVGNLLLQSVVKRLQSRLRPQDTFARLGGDEFTILVPDVKGKEQCANLAERVLGAFDEPFSVGGKMLPVQASIGLAAHPEDGDDVETILKNADTAMYQAKANGRNTYVLYDPGMSTRAQLRFSLEAGLRNAIEKEQLSVHYQPKLTTGSTSIVGVEALARWHHPQLGFIPPATFVKLAEETNLISPLGEWVLQTACEQARRWQADGLEGLSVAVNLSPRQFARQSVVGVVADVLDRTGLDPRLLELEVTESVLVEHMEETASSLAELREMGVRCSIDDFGTGYSALTYLTQMPIDAIKIDPWFVRRIDSESGAAPIVGAVISLAHSLNLQVVAEGVETEAQFRFLRDNACDFVQGYRFSPAVPAEVVNELLGSRTAFTAFDAKRPVANAADPLVPPTKLCALLSGAVDDARWSTDLSDEEIQAVLAALEADKIEPLLTGR
jgi:diguanylate cyclase (GGDEF)-like protein